MSETTSKTPARNVAKGQGNTKGPAQAPAEPVEAEAADELALDTFAGMPAWMEKIFPWAVSAALHAGIFLLILFTVAMAKRALDEDADREPIIIPTSLMNEGDGPPGGVPHPGTGGDPTRDAAQNLVKNVLQKDGWASKESDSKAGTFLEGNASDSVAEAIFAGTGATSGGSGKGGTGIGAGGPLAPYGVPGGGTGAGPKSNFYGTGGNAMRIVYILDHSGSMIENFSFLQYEVRKSVDGLLPVQRFSVIVFSENAEILGGAAQLLQAVPETRKDILSKMDRVVAQGQNDDLLVPFADAFTKAFSMNPKPQLVYFLTDGKFDPKLMEAVAALNKDKKVRINTIAFVNNKEPEYQEQLKKMAAENGGKYRFVDEKDLGK